MAKTFPILLDTNIVVSLFYQNDSLHETILKSIQDYESKQAIFLLNGLLVAEICTVILLRSKDVKLASKVRELLFNRDGNYEVTPFKGELERQTYRIFSQQKKPQLSVADCSLIAQAQILRVKHIYTKDKQLQKAVLDYRLRSP